MTPVATDPAAFLARQLPAQQLPLARYRLGEECTVWLRRARPGAHPLQRRLWALAARLSRVPALRPLPMAGAAACAAAQAARLREFAGQGLPVAQVLAQQGDGLLLGDAGTTSLAQELAQAPHAEALLTLWQQGLALIDGVHAHGLSLGSALPQHMVRGPEGALTLVYLPPDPAALLPAPLCQVRDALSYLYASAMLLHAGGAREAARPLWQAWLDGPARAPGFRQALQAQLTRLSWLRYLPPDARWGHAAWQLRAAYEQAVSLQYK
ncbi:hypothetical protein [Comamonas flocculans]|uniref:Serine/threonine protein kinase n=1 Tax=Comamonas flocculans TaxID=2597701 RepID=A0A5B8RWL7_9BURK|nr:hypothetical protein [Comamonas flocculans]QEA13104.1 hypothetical protein FOZ74_08700 [Comamonas flocculans]